MIVYSATLFIAFKDGSKQEEKISTLQYDLYLDEAQILNEYDFSLTYIVYPPLPPKFATVQAYQRYGYDDATK